MRGARPGWTGVPGLVAMAAVAVLACAPGAAAAAPAPVLTAAPAPVPMPRPDARLLVQPGAVVLQGVPAGGVVRVELLDGCGDEVVLGDVAREGADVSVPLLPGRSGGAGAWRVRWFDGAETLATYTFEVFDGSSCTSTVTGEGSPDEVAHPGVDGVFGTDHGSDGGQELRTGAGTADVVVGESPDHRAAVTLLVLAGAVAAARLLHVRRRSSAPGLAGSLACAVAGSWRSTVVPGLGTVALLLVTAEPRLRSPLLLGVYVVTGLVVAAADADEGLPAAWWLSALRAALAAGGVLGGWWLALAVADEWVAPGLEQLPRQVLVTGLFFVLLSSLPRPAPGDGCPTVMSRCVTKTPLASVEAP